MEATRRPVGAELFGGRLQGCWFLDLTVDAIVDHSPRLRTITFRSSDLVDFTWQPVQDLMFEVPGAEGVRRRYTIRRADPAGGTLDVDIVLHEHGRFATWAAGAAIGDRIEAIGPRGNGMNTSGEWYLLVGDESAIGVLGAMLDALPASVEATAIIATADGLPALDIETKHELRWVSESELLDALWARSLPDDLSAYVYGERTLVRDVCGLLASRGIAAEAITSKQYWRRGQSNANHGEPARD